MKKLFRLIIIIGAMPNAIDMYNNYYYDTTSSSSSSLIKLKLDNNKISGAML